MGDEVYIIEEGALTAGARSAHRQCMVNAQMSK
jgi:hypothetical protein